MKRYKKIIAILLSLALIISTFGIFEVSAATTDTRYSKKYLQNGGFEENEGKYNFSSNNYAQPLKTDVPYWDTTAFGSNANGTQGKLEFFKAGALHFSQSSADNKDVAQGEVAAELNADEISTIYQRINTVSGSTYTWGLDHRGRDTTDTMVLFIGPEQYDESGNVIDPSKPSKTGQDQFVKMTEWLKTQYGISYPDKGCSQKYTIYSRPFAAKGEFQKKSSANENFSMTKTDECNQEWNLWVISSERENKDPDTTKAIKGWSKYGTNCYNETDDSYNDVIKGENSKLGYDCTYTVPKGQTKTLFAFTSYSSGMLSSGSIKPEPTFGNLLDDINFKLYQPISSSITEGGNGGVHTGNATITSDIKNGNLFYSTVTDGQLCTIRTMRLDEKDTYEFQGAYVTVYKDDGTPVTRFIPIYKDDHDEISRLDKEQKLALSKKYFLPDGTTTTDENGVKKTWDYYFNVSVESPVHIHMMYTKAPYVLYDSNGGEPYKFGNNNLIGENLVGFRDGFQKIEGVNTSDYYKDAEITQDDHGNLIEKKAGFYKSHSALPNQKWNKNTFADGTIVGARFLGWAIKDSSNNLVILNGNHQVTYDPAKTGSGYVTFNNLDENGEIIKDGAVAGLELDATHGVTLTAQWQFGYTAQAQTLVDSVKKTYENSAVGGWVKETFITTDRDNNVVDYKKDINGETRIERTDAYAAVSEKIMFHATADSANNYVFEGWYTIDENGVETRISTTPYLEISVKEGKSTTYYARFKTKTVPVVFHYSPSGSGLEKDYEYYDANADNKYGRFFQEVEYKGTANKPKGDSKNVQMWFTSPTERDQEHLFNFSTQITEETHLYASPSFTFNYTNYFRIKEPWILETYCTLKFDGNYIDMKTDTNISDYTIYLLKGTSAAEADKDSPTSEYVRKNAEQTKKDSGNVLFDKTTKSGKTFNRAGVKYNNSYIYEMKKPVWVMFDFTYKGITYTSPVKNRSLYNNIDVYKTSNAEQWFSTLPSKTQSKMRDAQIKLVDSIKTMYSAVSKTEITEPSNYKPGVAVSGLTYDSTTDKTYNFTTSTAIRNIEPWGLKYTFSVDGQTITDFADYGAVVLTDKSSTYASAPTINELLKNENSVMFSKSSKNVYTNDKGEIEAYYINNMSATEFSKKTYVVFFVKDSNKTYYSSIVNNSYNDLATAENSEISKSIKNYSDALVNYFTLRDNAANQIA